MTLTPEQAEAIARSRGWYEDPKHGGVVRQWFCAGGWADALKVDARSKRRYAQQYAFDRKYYSWFNRHGLPADGRKRPS